MKVNKLKVAVIVLVVINIVLITLSVSEFKKITDNSIVYQKDSSVEFYRSFLPLRKWEVDYPSVRANSAVTALVDGDDIKLLFEKNGGASLPIASITKLMTVLVALDEYELNDRLVISESAYSKDFSYLYPGESYTVKDLIYASLIESNNTAAQALAEGKYWDDTTFISKMNQKARSFGLEQTLFSNPSGLDPNNPSTPINRSSPKDLVVFIEKILDKKIIWQALMTPDYNLKTADGLFKYTMINTNELIGNNNNMKGGKTGNTARAGGNFIAVFERKGKTIVTVVLNSSSRFNDTNLMLDWIERAYYWETI